MKTTVTIRHGLGFQEFDYPNTFPSIVVDGLDVEICICDSNSNVIAEYKPTEIHNIIFTPEST